MTGEEFIKENPDFIKGKPKQFDFFKAVHSQAIEHTRRLDKSELVNNARPNEPESIKDYRQANRRMISSSPINKFKTKTTRIFKSSGLSINPASISERLADYLDSKPYRYINRQTDLLTFFFECVYGESIDDPNGILVDFPINRDNPDVPPAAPVEDGGNPETNQIGIETFIVPYDKIVHADYDIFSFKGQNVELTAASGYKKNEPIYWIVDNEWWYRYMPISFDTNNKVVYQLQEWYRHDIGGADGKKELPINYLPGLLAKTLDGLMYQESLLSSYFHRADDFVSRHSDGQANWVLHCYPKEVMAEMPCPTCSGSGQAYKYTDGKKDGFETCAGCLGGGKITRPDQFQVLIKPERGMDDGGGGAAYELITPPTELLRITFDIPNEILALAKKEIGLDVLENIAESGTAKGMRLEDIKDFLSLIAEKIADCIETHLWYLECYLHGGENGRNQRMRPSVNVPTDFDLKTASDLREEVKESLPSDKYQAAVRYSDRLYKNNPNLKRATMLMYQWVPSILEDWQTVKDQLNGSIIDNDQIIKRNNAQWVFVELSQMGGFEDWTDERVFEEADKIMLESGLIIPPDQKAEEGSATRSKLLDTVGGVTGILQVAQSVALGEIGETEGVNILVEVFGFTREKADSFISGKATEQLAQPTNNGGFQAKKAT